MPKEIYNEGRVTGASVYEIYVKQHLIEKPDTPPASIQEWLSSTLNTGSSMVLKLLPTIGTDNQYTMLSIPLPEKSNLVSAGTIFASFFDGDAVYDTSSDNDTSYRWAERITSYGELISNTSTLHPESETDPVTDSNVPSENPITYNHTDELYDYIKIVDGIVIQPGTWKNSTETPPEMDFEPNLSEGSSTPVIRIMIHGAISHAVQILLTGFANKLSISGITKEGVIERSDHPENGDFLGPEVFPWASKIIFTMPTAFPYLYNSDIRYLDNNILHTFEGVDTIFSDVARPSIIGIPMPDGTKSYVFAINSNSTTPGNHDYYIPFISPVPDKWDDTKYVNMDYYNAMDDITWAGLITAFRLNKRLNILGSSLKTNKNSLQKPVSKVNDASYDWDGDDLYDKKSGASYLQYGDSTNGTLRVYGLKNSKDPRNYLNSEYNMFPDPTDIPLGSLAFGVGWHALYQVRATSTSRVWTPLYGAEFDSYTIQKGGSPESREFEYGLVIFGRADSATIDSIFPNPQAGQAGQYYIPTSYIAGTDAPHVVWIDNFGNPIVLHQGSSTYVIEVFFQFASNDNEVIARTKSIKFHNNSNGAATFMMIGKLHHAL